MPARAGMGTVVSRRDLTVGQRVVYTGRLSGGPRYGSAGVVREILVRAATVDMGRFGTWHIPYFFLSLRVDGA